MFNWKKVYFCSICCALVAFSTPTITNAYTLTEPEGVRIIQDGEWDEEVFIPSGDKRWFLGDVELEAYTISDGFGTRALPIGNSGGWENKGPGGLTTPTIWIDVPGTDRGASETTKAGVLSFGGGYFYGWTKDTECASQRYQTRNLNDYVNLQAVGAYAFESVPERTDGPSKITVPALCHQIEEYAWKNCTFLKKVMFLCPNITYMSPLAFDGCYDSLEKVKIATSMTESELRDAIAAVKEYAENGQDLADLDDAARIGLYDNESLAEGEPHKMNSVADFVATFEEHGFKMDFVEGETGSPNQIVLTKLKLANLSEALIKRLVYSTHDRNLLKEDLKVIDKDGNELDPSDYELSLRLVNKETDIASAWVKYENNDSLTVKDSGTYKVEYKIEYTGSIDESESESSAED